MNWVNQVVLDKQAKEDLDTVPNYILKKFRGWVRSVEMLGIKEIRKIKSYHDEPLKGDRLGQRSIKLNHAYRAIYIERRDNEVEIINVIEVNKHDY